jgi:hypothetical protein
MRCKMKRTLPQIVIPSHVWNCAGVEITSITIENVNDSSGAGKGEFVARLG